MNEKLRIEDGVLLGSWEDVKDLPLSKITKNDEDTTRLDGLILKGYETKFNEVNSNREKYDPGCLDSFVQKYFIDKELNMTLDIQHSQEVENLAGRVLYLEVNSVGFYFVCYIPRTYVKYEMVKNLLAEGILQGFSKQGWASDFDYIYTESGDFDYILIKEMDITSVSLVSQPANNVKFETIAEIKNKLNFSNKLTASEEPTLNEVEKLFNLKN